MSVWPGVYFDHNGDNRVTALDALRVINDLARLRDVPEGETAAAPWIAERLKVLPRSDLTDKLEAPSTFARELLVGASAKSVDAVARLAEILGQDRAAVDENEADVDQLLGNESFFDRLSD